VKKFPADEEAMIQLLQKRKKKIVENLQLKDPIEEFLNSCKENMSDYRVPTAILARDGTPREPAGKILKRGLKQGAQAV
jgi:acyl-CoA synthetase (AMP-forming)/AMP-acid ligase II